LKVSSEDSTELKALAFSRPNFTEFVSKPVEFVVDLLTYVPGLVYDFLVQTPKVLRALEGQLIQARRQPTLENLLACARPVVDAIGSAREFPFPLAYLP